MSYGSHTFTGVDVGMGNGAGVGAGEGRGRAGREDVRHPVSVHHRAFRALVSFAHSVRSDHDCCRCR